MGARGGREHRINVEIDRRTTTENAGGRMADDVDVGVLDGGEQTLSPKFPLVRGI